jgi:hypothetical protein
LEEHDAVFHLIINDDGNVEHRFLFGPIPEEKFQVEIIDELATDRGLGGCNTELSFVCISRRKRRWFLNRTYQPPLQTEILLLLVGCPLLLSSNLREAYREEKKDNSYQRNLLDQKETSLETNG